MTRYLKIAACVACVAVAAIVVTVLSLAGRSSPLHAEVGSAVPASAIGRLTTAARNFATEYHDTKPTSIVAVTAPLAEAINQGKGPGDAGGGEPAYMKAPVYLIVMTGKFRANIPVPQGDAPPIGSYLWITLNPDTFQVEYSGLSPRAPAGRLSRFGPETILGK